MRTGFNRIHSFISLLLEITGTNVFRESFFHKFSDKVRVSVFFVLPFFAVYVSGRCAYIYWEDTDEVFSALIGVITLIQVMNSIKEGGKN